MTAGGAGSDAQRVAPRFFVAPAIDPDTARRWRDLAESVTWAHYRQDPAWADLEAGPGKDTSQPWYFWAERDGSVCLTGIALRRRLPVPGRFFWEFDKGPTFAELDVLDEWLPWLLHHMGRAAARLRMAPPVPLSEGGDDVETALERHGFVRRRMFGGWATLVTDISRDEDEILRTFRSATQRAIRKSQRLEIDVRVEDSAAGWNVLAALQTELARSTPAESATPSVLERISRLWLRGGSGGTLLVARHQGEPLAAALVIVHRGTAHLPLIPSSRRHRELPATHLLVWEAMRWAKAHGCNRLDFAGYSLVARPGDALWGINQFKRGFAGLEDLRKSVAIHERVGAPVLVTTARLVRDAQARWGKPHTASRE